MALGMSLAVFSLVMEVMSLRVNMIYNMEVISLRVNMIYNMATDHKKESTDTVHNQQVH